MPELAAASRPADTGRFLAFRVDDRLYALAGTEIAEVIRMPVLARVPQAPESLLGLGNLRGRVAPVAGLRGLLGRDPARDQSAKFALILSGAAPVGLAIDEAPVLVTAERVQTDDAAMVAKPGELLFGVFGVGDEIAHVLDVRGLMARAFVPRSAKQMDARIRSPVGMTGVGRNESEITQKLISFMVAGQEFALELEVVREIIPAPDSVLAVPHSEDLVIGVASYRDALLPLLSLRGLLGLGRDTPPERSKVVVSSVGGALVGLVADQAKSILSVEEGASDPTPSVLAARTGSESQIKSIYRGDRGRRLVSVLAPDRLFRDDVMQRLTQTQTLPAPASMEATIAEHESQFVIFRLGEDEFALPIEAVIEVARVPAQITKLPKTPEFLEGVISFRGDVVPVVDQRRRFDMPVRENDERRRLVIVRSERHRAGLIVDAVTEVLSNPRDAIDPAPDLTGHQTRLVLGVINLVEAGRMVMVLDPTELLSRAERGLLDAFEMDASGPK